MRLKEFEERQIMVNLPETTRLVVTAEVMRAR